MPCILRALACVVSALLLAGCSEPAPEHEVLATVNGAPVYDYELSLARERTLGEQGMLLADASTDRKVLESLVAGRAMALLAEQDMSEQERTALAHQVAAWREEQLVKRYLSEHVVPVPVPQHSVNEYYQRHPELFGGGTRYRYEQLSVATGQDTALRDKAVRWLGQTVGQNDWQALANTGRAEGLPVNFRQGTAAESLGSETLRARLKAMQPGEVSAVSLEAGEASLLKLVVVEMVPPRPLSEVSDDIRLRLAPMQLRQGIREVMDQATAQADIQYLREE
ncbi:hypothetical protein A167_01311 [Alcanivorax sp. S71-1-4]|uniref:peptidyl-prolyl cis-trans isomerase n=1 Tax=Alcanivorax sp. S71-1-4 TaxID=1177159 RepID=UPI001356E9C1|nr:peptidyl-prolyl cis-trans isomerase [Alcanivorax sp. S71-1-4]KAF0810010.1 hypothetical protein A167_01311 [Alcanivorax sp. S71-1-4]